MNLDIIKELSKNYTVALPDWLLKCGLHIAGYGTYEVPGFRYWETYQFWQYTNTTNWTGATSICLEKRPGTRAELKEWCKNPISTWKPGETPPPPPEPEEPPAPGQITCTADERTFLDAMFKVTGKA